MSATLPEVASLVPHKPPMLLLDGVVSFDDRSLTARVQLTESSPFVEDGQVPGLVAIEYMAQAIAAFAGTARRKDGQPPKLGFLLSCREMVIDVPQLAVGDELLVTARQVWSDATLGSFDCAVTRGGERVAAATLSVYQGDLPASGAP